MSGQKRNCTLRLFLSWHAHTTLNGRHSFCKWKCGREGTFGEAAGAAAARSLREDITPRAIVVPTVHAELRVYDGILDEDDATRVNNGATWFWQGSDAVGQ